MTTPSPPRANWSPSRRSLLLAGAAGAAVTLAACTDDGATSLGTPTARGVATTPSTLPLTDAQAALGTGGFSLFTQTDLDFQTKFALGEAGQLTVAGEVAAVVAQANAAPGGATYQSVFDAFVAMGNRLQDAATTSVRHGRLVTARSQFLRAARYYGQALYWVLGTSTPDAEARTYTALDDSYRAAIRLFDVPPVELDVPYEGGSLPTWLFRPADDGAARPTVIINNGSDGQHVDLLAQGGFAALERGYNVVIFEGPGQGSMLFLRDIPFRHDWEQVVTPIVDALEDRQDVDASRIAIRGISFGGELAPRAAAFEPRIAALVADPGSTASILDYPAFLRDLAHQGTKEQVNQAWADGIIPGATPEQLFSLKKTLEIFTRQAHDEVKAGGYPTDWYGLARIIERYHLDGAAQRITCPTLVTWYQGDTAFTDEPMQLLDMLTSARRKDLVRFTSVDGAQQHCGPMAPQVANEACWDWLDDVFGR
jgi:dienelactone hydrolase